MNNKTSENVNRNYKIVLSDVLFLLSHAFKTKIEIDCCQIYPMRLILLLCQINCRAGLERAWTYNTEKFYLGHSHPPVHYSG